MDLRILEFEYNNIREMKHLKINLERTTEKPYKNSIIQMPNGTGKTTTMRLFRYILDGSANEMPKNEIKSFTPLFDTDENTGSFIVKLKMNNEIVHVFLEFDFENYTVEYYTTRLGGWKIKRP